ncbi:MAG: type II secretion system minor pseudopilin GspH [Pseudomonadota bacterium]
MYIPLVQTAARVVMTISAAGNNHAALRGFTLVELLVILIVLALVSGVVLTALPRSGADAQKAAYRLAGYAEARTDQAVLEGRPLGIDLVEGRLASFSYGEDGWRRMAAPRSLSIDERMILTLTANDDFALEVEEEDAELLFRSSDEEDEAPARLSAPPVIFDPTGEVTPFTLRIDDRGDAFVVDVSASGQLEVRRAKN